LKREKPLSKDTLKETILVFFVFAVNRLNEILSTVNIAEKQQQPQRKTNPA